MKRVREKVKEGRKQKKREDPEEEERVEGTEDEDETFLDRLFQ